MLHTRVPALLEQELKQLATALRLPVSNLVRTILEDALAAADRVGERAEGELRGIAERLSRHRDSLRRGVAGGESPGSKSPSPVRGAVPAVPVCPAERPPVLEGAIGYDRLVLAAEVACTACGKRLPSGSAAFRAVFEGSGPRVLLGGECRLVPRPVGGSQEE